MNEIRETLIRYRLEQADESLESAQILLNSKKYRPSVSRSYYAMSYGVLALLVKEAYEFQNTLEPFPFLTENL